MSFGTVEFYHTSCSQLESLRSELNLYLKQDLKNPTCRQIESIRSHGKVWKYKGEAYVLGSLVAEAEISAMIEAGK